MKGKKRQLVLFVLSFVQSLNSLHPFTCGAVCFIAHLEVNFELTVFLIFVRFSKIMFRHNGVLYSEGLGEVHNRTPLVCCFLYRSMLINLSSHAWYTRDLFYLYFKYVFQLLEYFVICMLQGQLKHQK